MFYHNLINLKIFFCFQMVHSGTIMDCFPYCKNTSVARECLDFGVFYQQSSTLFRLKVKIKIGTKSKKIKNL